MVANVVVMLTNVDTGRSTDSVWLHEGFPADLDLVTADDFIDLTGSNGMTAQLHVRAVHYRLVYRKPDARELRTTTFDAPAVRETLTEWGFREQESEGGI